MRSVEHEVKLTDRETEVLLRVAKGYTLPEIGVQLGLSRHTIADYVKQIYRKLNVTLARRGGAGGAAPAAWSADDRDRTSTRDTHDRTSARHARGKNPPQVLVDCHGVGYEVDVPMSTFYNLPALGERVTLLTHFVVREDAQLLFGFLTAEERSPSASSSRSAASGRARRCRSCPA